MNDNSISVDLSRLIKWLAYCKDLEAIYNQTLYQNYINPKTNFTLARQFAAYSDVKQKNKHTSHLNVTIYKYLNLLNNYWSFIFKCYTSSLTHYINKKKALQTEQCKLKFDPKDYSEICTLEPPIFAQEAASPANCWMLEDDTNCNNATAFYNFEQQINQINSNIESLLLWLSPAADSLSYINNISFILQKQALPATERVILRNIGFISNTIPQKWTKDLFEHEKHKKAAQFYCCSI